MKLTPDDNHFKFSTETIAVPLYFVLFLWIVYWIELQFGYNFGKYGMYPRTIKGLTGIFVSPFLHSNLKHLFNNSVPLFVLLSMLLYFYNKIAYKVLIVGTIILGVLTWLIGRSSLHLGASGIVYLLFSFIFFSGIIRKYYRLTAVSLVVIFLYGGMVWYLFPIDSKISWEGHLSGFIAGLLLAIWYRKIGPKPYQYAWEKPNYQKDNFDLQFDENGNFIYPKPKEELINDSEKIKINYIFKENNDNFANKMTESKIIIQQNISLKEYNTFGIDVRAEKFTEVFNLSQLKTILQNNKNVFILGGGSNMLLTKDLEKLVIKLNLKGITVLNQNNDFVEVEVMAGENWHQFVLWAIKNDFGGIENLSLIPGNVGACPIQNIGAYGVEVNDVIKSVNVLDKNILELKNIPNKLCNFEYRNSIFKQKLKDKIIITSVVFRLTKNKHNIKASYGSIQNELEKKGIISPTIKDISDAVIKIRSEKLPNPLEIGNSGSFFKNPIVDKKVFTSNLKEYPKMPFYQVGEQFKIPAGWLIEKCGYKGKRFGDAGVHKNQALVLVNYGNASGTEILNLANTIRESVKKKFNINLETEVNIF
jgi:UDP-N-acetylmuramate dehydrogenase